MKRKENDKMKHKKIKVSVHTKEIKRGSRDVDDEDSVWKEVENRNTSEKRIKDKGK